ncbi:MAG TPA: hypothetical protein VGV40_11905 [Solirubrobacteraceae bacterium]|nr:hypothetical protein [Solirubrobacteraceae bacterium]
MLTLLTSYYDGPDFTDRVPDALRQAGLDPEHCASRISPPWISSTRSAWPPP